MLNRSTAKVIAAGEIIGDVQEIRTDLGPALNYAALTGPVLIGQRVLLNRTARLLNLGTGGYDFVMANLSDAVSAPAEPQPGHIIKARYTPIQHAVMTLEERPEHAAVWNRRLDGFPVIVGQLHSQLAPISFALHQAGFRAAYVMTDGAALPMGLSKLAPALLARGCIAHTITAGQAFGGGSEAITVASALLASRYILECDAAIVIQGPGNAGSGTRYGFSGLEQASHLNTTAALGGSPIAVVRMSRADPRPRHQGVSHHTLTSLDMALAPCDVPVPAGSGPVPVPARHRIREVEGTGAVLIAMQAAGIKVASMGRTPQEDPEFFEAAAASGIYASKLIAHAQSDQE